MTSLTREVWGREFDLQVAFEDLDDVGVYENQWKSLGSIISEWQVIDGAIEELEEYCLKQNPDELKSQPLDNIFHYVVPKFLFIPQGDKRRTVALMCDYRFDPEHGIALVFENEKLSTIGAQDVIL